MFLSRNKKNNVYPCKPQFYYIKVGFKMGGGGSKIYRICHSECCFRDESGLADLFLYRKVNDGSWYCSVGVY